MIKLKNLLKEYTDDRFKGSELISKVRSSQPDIFNKKLFADILPKGEASEPKAIKALAAHDRSPIKKRMGQYAPMFVHVQYHEFEHEGEKYRLHQSQYYNNNFADRDPDFNPRVTQLTLIKDPKGEEEIIGKMLVKTEEYLEDLKRLKITKSAS